VPETNQLSIAYLIDPDPRGSMGLGGRQAAGLGNYGNFVTAIDPKTGRIAWRHTLPGGGGPTGMLTTAGGLLFAGDGAGNLVAFDAANGTPPLEYPARHRDERAADLHARRQAATSSSRPAISCMRSD